MQARLKNWLRGTSSVRVTAETMEALGWVPKNLCDEPDSNALEMLVFEAWDQGSPRRRDLLEALVTNAICGMEPSL